MSTLQAVNLSKRIGKRDIIRNVSFSLESGKVYGFVGENGAGKSVLFRIICGLVKPTEGRITMNDKAMVAGRCSENIGVVLDHSEMWPDMTGFQNLKYLALINNRISDNAIKEAMERVGLDPENKLTVRKYSLGMKQRLMLAQGFMEKPDFLFLDEPTNAIDAEGLKIVRRIIAEEAGRGALVILSSHNRDYIEELCSEVFFIDKGRVVNHEIKTTV